MPFRVRPVVFQMLLSTILVSLLAGCGAQAVKPRPEAAFQYAFATPSCAPWDGAATRLVLQKHPAQAPKSPMTGPAETYPSISINLWLSTPPLNQWIPLSGNNGSESVCTGQNQCKNPESRVKLTVFTDTRIEGELRERMEDGTNRELVYPFQAPMYPIRMFCG